MTYNTDIERLNYYEGEFLGAVDFAAEQEYHRDMRRRHNLGQHTWGIVTGLDLAQAPNGGMDGSAAEVDVYLQPGMAVDGLGREIVVLSQAQLTAEMFAAFYDPNPSARPIWMYVWISYQQALLQPPADACSSVNASNAYARIQETYTLTVTAGGAPPVNSAIVVDGTQTTPPTEPSASSSSSSTSSGSSGSSTPPDPPLIPLPYDDSVPFQEFSTDDSTLVWWIALGRVMWDPHNEVFLQINSDPAQAAASAGKGREYAGNVSATVYAPAGSYTIVDRNSPYPAPPSAADPNLGGVQAEVAGSLLVDYLLNAEMNAVIGGAYDSNSTVPLSPLTIIASSAGTDEQLIQFRDPTNNQTWYINQEFDGKTPGLNIGEVNSAGTNVDNRIFIQPTTTSSSAPSPQNVGIGTSTPRNPLAIRGQGSWWELLSFEDNSGNTKWHVNHNPQGKSSAGAAYTPGMNFSETGVADFRLFLQTGGNVGIGTGAPVASLDIASGPLHVGGSTTPAVTSPGAYLGWNVSGGTGETDFINNQGSGSGGFAFVNTPSAGTPLTTLMTIAGNGNVGIGTTSPQQNLSIYGGLNIDQGNQNTGSALNPGLSFGSSSGEGIASQRTGGNEYGLNFYTGSQLRMSIASNANGGGVSITGSLNVDQADLNTGLGLNPGLSFGASSGEGIASQRTGANDYNLNFYTGYDLRMSIASNANGGGVSTTGNLVIGAAAANQQFPAPGALTINGNRTYMLGTDTGNWHWIMAGGTAEFDGAPGTPGNNAIGLSYDSATNQGWIVTYSNWNVWFGGSKGGFVVDRFVNLNGEKLERGDVLVIHKNATGPLHGSSNRIPLIEVERAKTAHDPRVCGVVDEPTVRAAALKDLDQTQIANLGIGLMVTLGSYACCKVDADIAPIAAGDLLTTSPTEGHAQKLDLGSGAQAGIVIGKALASLDHGKGSIPVLISHQ